MRKVSFVSTYSCSHNTKCIMRFDTYRFKLYCKYRMYISTRSLQYQLFRNITFQTILKVSYMYLQGQYYKQRLLRYIPFHMIRIVAFVSTHIVLDDTKSVICPSRKYTKKMSRKKVDISHCGWHCTKSPLALPFWARRRRLWRGQRPATGLLRSRGGPSGPAAATERMLMSAYRQRAIARFLKCLPQYEISCEPVHVEANDTFCITSKNIYDTFSIEVDHLYHWRTY